MLATCIGNWSALLESGCHVATDDPCIGLAYRNPVVLSARYDRRPFYSSGIQEPGDSVGTSWLVRLTGSLLRESIGALVSAVERFSCFLQALLIELSPDCNAYLNKIHLLIKCADAPRRLQSPGLVILECHCNCLGAFTVPGSWFYGVCPFQIVQAAFSFPPYSWMSSVRL